MSNDGQVTCVERHILPAGFHHHEEARREPCPECGTTGRRFSSIDAPGFGMSALDLAPVSVAISTSWRVHTRGSEAIEARTAHSYTVEIERIVDGLYRCSILADGEVIGMADDVATTLMGVAGQITRAMKRDAERRFEGH